MELNTTTLVLGIAALVYVAYKQVTTQRIAISKLWTMPLILVVVAWTDLKPSILQDNWQMFLLALALGFGVMIGLVRGVIGRIEFDPRSNEIVVHGSITALLMWISLIVLEVAVKYFLFGTINSQEAGMATASALLTIAGAVGGRRLVWFLKCQPQVY